MCVLADTVVFGCARCATARNMADFRFVRSLIRVDMSENAEVDTEEAPLFRDVPSSSLLTYLVGLGRLPCFGCWSHYIRPWRKKMKFLFLLDSTESCCPFRKDRDRTSVRVI